MQTSPATFKRNTAVIYHGQNGPQRRFIAGKIGAYCVLSLTKHSDSGCCIPFEELDKTVFPAPNEHGVFEEEVCQTFGARLDRQFYVEVHYVQAGPMEWCASLSRQFGNSYSGSLPSQCDVFPTFEAAMKNVLSEDLRQLARFAAGSPSGLDHGVSQSKLPTARKFAKDAIYKLLYHFEPSLYNDILISLMKNSDHNHG